MKKIQLLAALILLCNGIINAQIKTADYKVCRFDGGKNAKEEICPNVQFNGFKTNDGIENLVNKITARIGLKPNFILIPCPKIKNAMALLYNDNVRYIIYDKPFLDDIAKNVKTNWSNMMILSHEIGHHLNGHTLKSNNKEVTKKEELEADEFAGFILGKMGATIAQSIAAMDGISHPDCDIEYFSDHPCKVKRINAIKIGWNNATNKKYIISEKQKAAQKKIIPINQSTLKGTWYTELDNERGQDGFQPLTITFTNETTITYKFYNTNLDTIVNQFNSKYILEKNILTETFPYKPNFKATAKVEMLSKRALLLTIINNGSEGYEGLKRVYIKLEDEKK